MNPFVNKAKSWLSTSFQLITLLLLLFTISLLFKQQRDIIKLKAVIGTIYSNVDDANGKIEDLDTKLDKVESSLSENIEDVKNKITSRSYSPY